LISLVFVFAAASFGAADFGPDWKDLDSGATGEWWKKNFTGQRDWLNLVKVPRDEVVAFGLYTVDKATLKLSAQLYPLYPDETREVRLEFKIDGEWTEVAQSLVYELGWSAHFRVENWDESKNIAYRLRHGEKAFFEGFIRANPRDKREIVVASLSCNSRWDRGGRESIVANIQAQDPDMVFFAGDQSYDHREHTAAWLLWGEQFREIIRDRPTVTIPDDHDIGQGNLWGEGGIKTSVVQGHDGGYFYPAEYVNMVHRCQTWHLPDAYDPTAVAQGISVYYTSYNVGGVDFAILGDRQFKSGPNGKIPNMGPRPDHVNDPSYNRKSVDLPGLKLLGDRQLSFLDQWGQDWSDTEMKCVLSQTNFAGAVHIHGTADNRLLADMDSNGWPQTGRRKALASMRRAMAFHLAGDQHLAVVTKHGIDAYRDGPVTFVNPAIVNTVYGRWWWPEDEKAGGNPIEGSPLPWTGDYEDGFGNKVTMYGYANPDLLSGKEKQKARLSRDGFDLGDGYGLARFDKTTRSVVFECWPRFAKVEDGDGGQFPGWPMEFDMMENDGRKPVGYLPELVFSGVKDPVVQVVNEQTGEILYTVRASGSRFKAKVYSDAPHTVKVGADRPSSKVIKGLKSVSSGGSKRLKVRL